MEPTWMTPPPIPQWFVAELLEHDEVVESLKRRQPGRRAWEAEL